MDNNHKVEMIKPSIPVTASAKQGYVATVVGIVANVVLVIIKLYAGFVGRSQALLADGVHSLSDLFSDFVVLLGLKWGRKGEDRDHPFGHGRIETISSMIIGIFLSSSIQLSVPAAVCLWQPRKWR